MKITEIFKKYKVFLILIVILLLLLVVLLLLPKKGKVEDGYSDKKEKIETPYEIWTDEITIHSELTEIDVPKEGKILKVIGFNTNDFESFVKNFYKFNLETNFTEDFSVQFNDRDFIFFYPSTGVASVIHEKGLPLEDSIDSEESLQSFFDEYFGIKEIKSLSNSRTNTGIEYKGRFVLHDVEIGSSYLEGNAFIIEVNNRGYIVNISILLINESVVQKSHYLPLADITNLVRNQKYPKKMGKNIIENRYYEQPSPYILSDYYAKQYELIYVYNDSNNGYILPTYLVKGDGRIKDSYNEQYWSEMEFFYCAIDPSYLLTKEVINEKGDGGEVEQEGVPFL